MWSTVLSLDGFESLDTSSQFGSQKRCNGKETIKKNKKLAWAWAWHKKMQIVKKWTGQKNNIGLGPRTMSKRKIVSKKAIQ